MPINWKATETCQRLLAAIYAASPQSHNYQKIATLFGEGATYDAIEGRFRIIKREAARLAAEVEAGARPAAPAKKGNGPANVGGTGAVPKKNNNTKSKVTMTEKKNVKREKSAGGNAKQRVLTGRVTKASNGKRGDEKNKDNDGEARTGDEDKEMADCDESNAALQPRGCHDEDLDANGLKHEMEAY